MVKPHHLLAETLTDPPKPYKKRKRRLHRKKDGDATGNKGHAASEPAVTGDSFERNKWSREKARPSLVEVLCFHALSKSSISTGIIVGGRNVVTNADSVHQCTQVSLRTVYSARRYVARVLAVGNECKLALLTVDDDEFWNGVSPVEFGCLPQLVDRVTVVAYPTDPNTLSFSGGIASCIDMLPYADGSSTKLLCLLINVASNLRVLGAPAFNDEGQCIGISLQSLKFGFHNDNRMAYLVPAAVIWHFIEDYKKSKGYTGLLAH